MASITVLATMVALPALFLVPGWLWLRRCGVDPLVAVYAGPGVMAAVAAAVVGLGLLLPWGVRTTCLGAGALVLVSCVWCVLTAPWPVLPPRADLAGVAVFLAAFVAAAAFVAVPSRPPGVGGLGVVPPGRIDTARFASMPSDNTLPYRTGQVALYKQSGQLRDVFAPGWWITDRTPLVGLDFAFGTGALGVPMRSDNPDLHSNAGTQMQIKDPYAYWFYNQVSELLAAAAVLGAFLLARVWKRDVRIATAAALVAALSPGLFLNTIYTWPKAAIAYFVLAAAALALRRASVGAGVFVALAYLCHPAGGFWAPSVLAVLLLDGRLRARWAGVVARFAGAVVIVVLPWQLFSTLHMHAFSRWLFWPLGAVVTDRTNLGAALSSGWRQFEARGIAGNLWVRVESTATSLFPTDLSGPGAANGMPHLTDTQVYWARAHGFSIWGMVGLVLFPAVILWIARNWRTERAMLIALVVAYVVVAVLAAGFPDTWSSQSAYPLIGVCAILAGEMLLAVRRRMRALLWLSIAVELLTTAYISEYAPYHAPAVAVVGFAVLGIGAQICLLAALASRIGLRPRAGGRTQRLPRQPEGGGHAERAQAQASSA